MELETNGGLMAIKNKGVCKDCGSPTQVKGTYKETTYYHGKCSNCNNLKSRYGIDIFQREEMLSLQDRKCLCCSTPIEFVGNEGRGANIDHVKGTKKVRGILCSCCNVALGYAFHNPIILTNLATYIKEYNNG